MTSDLEIPDIEIITVGKAHCEPPDLSVVIVTRMCPNQDLAELLDSTIKFSFNYEIIIVSDSIQDRTHIKDYLSDYVKSLPNMVNCRLIRQGKDKGPSYGRNLGAALAKSSKILFADDDVVIVEDVSPLVDCCRSNEYQGVQPLTLKFSKPEIIDSAGEFIRKDNRGILYVPYSRGANQPITNLSKNLCTEEVPSMRGAFMIVQKDAFYSIGGFDATLDFGYEDVDLGWRMVLAGYKMLLFPTVKVLHKGGRSTISKKSDTKSEMTHLVNFHIIQLRPTNNLCPYILLHFYDRVLDYELWNIKNLKHTWRTALMNTLIFTKLLVKRAKSAPRQKENLIKNFSLKGKSKFEEFANGKRFIPDKAEH